MPNIESKQFIRCLNLAHIAINDSIINIQLVFNEYFHFLRCPQLIGRSRVLINLQLSSIGL